MKEFSRIISVLFLLLMGYDITVIAGEKDITILDPDLQPMAGVVVSVFSPKDSVICEAVISGVNGRVFLSDSIAGNNIILTNAVGFEQRSILFEECGDTIILAQSAKDLKEVVVLGNKDQVRTEAGKIIFTPGNLKTQVSSGLEMIQYAPLVSIQDNNLKNLKVLGKNAHILINGKEPTVPQDQVLTALMGTPPSWIKSIEVITTPGSEYSASGNMGIINVNMIDNRKGAWLYLSLDGGLGDGDSNSSGNAMLYFSHKKFKMQASVYGSWSDYMLRSEKHNIFNPDSPVEKMTVINKSSDRSLSGMLSGALFMSYDLSKNSIIGGGISATSNKQYDQYDVTTTTTKANNENEQTELTRSIMDQPWGKPKMYYKLFYNLNTDKKGSRLEISGIYRHEKSKSYTRYDFDPEMNESRGGKDRGGAAVANYTQVFNSRQTLKGGYSFQTTSLTDFANTPLQNTLFHYNETIHAAYLDLTSIWSKVFSTTLGVRLESEMANGKLNDGTQLFDRHETDVFPTVEMTFSFPGDKHSLILTARRGISRPGFNEMNPYVLWTSGNSCIVGNPELKSNKPWNVSAMYIFLQHYFLYADYSKSENSLSQWIFGKDGITFLSRMNSPRECVTASFEFNKELTEIWRFSASIDFAYFHTPFSFEGIKVNENGYQYGLSINNSLFFKNKYIPKISISGLLDRTVNDSASGSSWYCQASLNLSKEIFKSFNVSLSMIARPLNRLTHTYEQSGFIQKSRYLDIPLSGSLSISYYFGRTQIRTYQDRGDDSYNSRF